VFISLLIKFNHFKYLNNVVIHLSTFSLFNLIVLLILGMAMGWNGDEFYLPRFHTLLSYIYLLPYPYSAGIRNRISSPSSSPTSSGISAPSPSSYWTIFLIKIKIFFRPECNVVMHYQLKRLWWWMTKVIEKREAENVRYGRRKKRTMINECHLKDQDSDCVSKWFRVWLYIYIKGVINWFSTFGTGLGMSSWWVPIFR